MNTALNERELIEHGMHDIITTFQIDLVELLCVDSAHSEIQVLEAVSDTSVNVLEFDYVSMREILRRLAVEKTGFQINSNSNPFHRVNSQFQSEVFIPYFGMDSNVAGFLYCAKCTELSGDIMNTAELTRILRLLIPLIEHQHLSEQLQTKLQDTVMLFVDVINAREPHNIFRDMSVFYWSKKIADDIKLSQSDIHKMHLAVMMQGLGKIYMSDRFLNEQEALSPSDPEIFNAYINHSYDIAERLSHIFELDDIPKIILHSHERVDGKGYPDGLSGTEIPLISRIIYLAEAISEMLTTTPKRVAMPTDLIIEKIMEQANERFDGELAQSAARVLLTRDSDYLELFQGLGNYVTLSLELYKEEPRNIWGSLRKNKDNFEFFPSTPLRNLKFNQITSIFMFTNINEGIQKYKPDLKKIYEDKLVFAALTPYENEKTFSIQWALSGVFITEDKKHYLINIIRVGGDFIDFFINKDEQTEVFSTGIITLRLDDGKLLSMGGIITFSQGFFDKTYYRFEYTNISETTQKNLFSAIFKKQLEIRKTSFNYLPRKHTL